LQVLHAYILPLIIDLNKYFTPKDLFISFDNPIKAVDYLKENNFFNQNLKNNEMHDIENILKNPNP
jgi:hypothetical protein